MNRFGCSVVHAFPWQPTRDGLKGFSSTATGAAAGASAGASVGSVIPVVGTAVGAILGAVGGAIASAFTRTDPEQKNFEQAVALWQANPNAVYSIGNKYLPLAGLFDLHLNNPSIPIYRKYGRMGEERFVNDMVNLIYTAAQQGRITASDNALSIMSRIVQPWIDSWGYGPMTDVHADLIQRLMVGMINDYIAGAQTNWHAVGGQYPFGSLPGFALPAAAAAVSAPAPAQAQAPAPVPTINPVGSPAPAPAPASSSGYAPAGTVLTQDTNASMATPIGLFVSSANGAFNFQPPGSSAQTQIALTPAHTGGAGTVQMQWNGSQVIATNNDGSQYWFNPATQAFVQTRAATMPQYTGPGAATLPAAILPPIPVSIPQTNVTNSPTVATTSAGQPVTQSDLQAMVGQLAAQGQTAQQAFTNALQTLQSSGVQSTPQVQQAVQSAVQSTPAPATAGVSSSGLPGWTIAAAIAGLLFATARPASALPRKRRRASR